MGSSPQIIRSKVDLPQPDGPTKTTNSPCSTARSIPWMTSTVPKDLDTALSSMAAMRVLSPIRCESPRIHKSRLYACYATRILTVIRDEQTAISGERHGRVTEILVGQSRTDHQG